MHKAVRYSPRRILHRRGRSPASHPGEMPPAQSEAPPPSPRAAPGAGIGVVLLAAGESNRMIEPKQLLPWRGLPLIQYQLRELRETSAQEIVVVLGYLADETGPLVEPALEDSRVSAVLNAHHREGKTTSIKTGLASLRTQVAGVMLLAVDQPRPRRVLQRLMESHLRGNHLITVPSHRGRHGHPPLFDVSLMPELMRITESRQGIREVIEGHREALRTVDIDDPIVLTNLNTPEDYRRAVELPGA